MIPAQATPVFRLSHGHLSLFVALIGVVVLLGFVVFYRHSPGVARLLRMGGDAWAVIVPRAFAFTTFLAGVILLFSGATPGAASRIGWINDVLPVPVVELSAYFESIAGVALIVLARGLQRRLDVAYHLTLWVLGAGIVVALTSALDIEQAIFLVVMLIALLPNRRFFYRRASLLDERFTRGWYLAIGGVLVATALLTYLGYGHRAVSGRVFWEYGDRAEAPRATRAFILTIVALLALSLTRLLRPSLLRRASVVVDDAVVEAIVRDSPRAYAHLALLGDKEIIADPSGLGFIMVGTAGRSRVAMGDPVGPPEAAAALVDSFVRQCDREGTWPVFYRVGPQLLYLYLDYGLSAAKLGEVARVQLADFSLDGPTRRNLRYVRRKLVSDGCSFELVPSDRVPSLMRSLRAVSDDWLRGKKAREKGFSLGRFDERFVARGPVGVVRAGGSIVAFASLWLSGGRAEAEVDLMRMTSDAPPSVMRFLLTEAMLWARAEGYAYFNLGMVPLAGIRTGTVAPLWNQIASAMRVGGERYYNFQGLREFKGWFHPEWEPSYLVSAGGTRRPIIVANIASLISGGATGVLRR
ncbi:MAG: phosphatidylglycerol lysyltransferase domain-containing protein [Gemmatimonadales bacterium]